MVVIGHSQGGLLTKMLAIESGTKIWDAISDKPVDELNLKPETKALLKEALFVHPLPFVETVIFIATPHGGSFQASPLVVGLFRRLVTLPERIVSATAAAPASANGLNLDIAAETELERNWQIIEKIRAKWAAKPKISPLPQ